MTEFLTWMYGNPDKLIMTGGLLISIAGLALLVEALVDKRGK